MLESRLTTCSHVASTHTDHVEAADERDEEPFGHCATDAEGRGDVWRVRVRPRGGELGEGFEWSGRVCGRAGRDEGGCEGEDGVGADRRADDVGARDFGEGVPLDGLVETLGDEDRGGGGQDILTQDDGGAAQVGGYADAFED